MPAVSDLHAVTVSKTAEKSIDADESDVLNRVAGDAVCSGNIEGCQDIVVRHDGVMVRADDDGALPF